MATRHRVKEAFRLAASREIDNWAAEQIETPGHAYFVFEDPRAAQVLIEALSLIFKSNRKQVIHNGRKP